MSKKESLTKVLDAALRGYDIYTCDMAISVTDLEYINKTVEQHGVFATQINYDDVYNPSLLIVNIAKRFPKDLFTDEVVKEIGRLAVPLYTKCPAFSPVSIDTTTGKLHINTARFGGVTDITESIEQLPKEVVECIIGIIDCCPCPNAAILSEFLIALMQWAGHPFTK